MYVLQHTRVFHRGFSLVWRKALTLMKRLAALFFVLFAPLALHAQARMDTLLDRLESGVLGTIVYVILGIVLLVLAFKVKDFLLPGNLSKQLVEDRNMAVAVVTSAFLLGISIIIAAAIAG